MNLLIAAVVSVVALCIIEGVFLVLAGRSTAETRRIKKQLEEALKRERRGFPGRSVAALEPGAVA